MKLKKILPLVVLTITTPSAVFAASCKDYPARPGIEVIETNEGGIKIKSTAWVSVPINDTELYLDSLEEAEIEAKAKIARFLSEEVASKCLDEKTKRLTIDVSHEGSKSINYQKVKTTLCSIQNSSSALLKGAMKISDCYTPGSHVMVSVGIKSTTINKANKLSKEINRSQSNSFNIFNRSGKVSPVEGKSNIEGYLDF